MRSHFFKTEKIKFETIARWSGGQETRSRAANDDRHSGIEPDPRTAIVKPLLVTLLVTTCEIVADRRRSPSVAVLAQF
ncbi:hypothetical protein JJD41_22920 [Oxynema sp. CENA135]|uniref:hypothetical protein n=1 Tax=Oxynema sp. CENA135 TaxID=984206 RepID=UPI00190B9A29|nr:hypothetical protein [Oxynema sp. CENA135]MBK4732695.1 hypothetical protein [Oxynema sp. CENA135]